MGENDAPSFSERNFKDIVTELDEDHYKDPDVYVFSNGRVFKCTDRTGGGAYGE